jgi:hypothetical protein
VGIYWLLHSTCCFLNINTAITWQLIWTARMLEAKRWQVCGEVWVRGKRKISQVLGMFGLLDFTMLWPVLAWWAFLNLWTTYFFNFEIFFSGRGQPRVPQSTCTPKIKTRSSHKHLVTSTLWDMTTEESYLLQDVTPVTGNVTLAIW